LLVSPSVPFDRFSGVGPVNRATPDVKYQH
jgi:hypothetical protein